MDILKNKKVSYKKGREILIKADFTQCPNIRFLEKDGNYYHYNTISKKWIYN